MEAVILNWPPSERGKASLCGHTIVKKREILLILIREL